MTIRIRDSIHGSIILSSKELELMSHPAFQRLRNIRQLGFADFAFPGATHSRYAHSLGAMEMASRIFDSLFPIGSIEPQFQKQIRQALRLAILLHDLGHAPFSHATEACMPSKKSLGLNGDGPASHEDYTFKLITDSSFSKEIQRLFDDEGITSENITELNFKQNGLDYQPILKQIISSECDADRMDYLQRDSFYCGVNYGKFDADWLIHSLIALEKDKRIYLSIQSKGIFSFEDFLLSRYHMFASVYLHRTPVIFEKMLQKYFQDRDKPTLLPTNLEEYIGLDDIEIWTRLRNSQNPWAKRIVERNPLKLISDEIPIENHMELCEKLQRNEIDFIESRAHSMITTGSPYPFYVQTKRAGTVPLESYTELFKRYERPAQFNRIYVSSENESRAAALSQTL